MSLKIGMKSVDITPPAPVSISGQFRIRISEGMESPLFANIFVLEKEGSQIIICSCDLGGIIEEFNADVRKKVAQRCPDIKVEDIMISATHIHTGPDTYPKRPVGFIEQKYLPYGIHVIANEVVPPEMWDGNKCRDYITTVVAEGICDAWESRSEAYFGAAFGRAVVGHCRRAVYEDGSARLFGTTQVDSFSYIEAGEDSGVELLYVFNEDKRPVGALVNVACPAQVVEDMKVISSDYWGKVRDYVHAELGDDFVVVGLLSAAGDQCPVDLIRRFRMKNADNRMYRRSDTFSMENNYEGTYEIGKRLGREIIERIPEAVRIMKDDAVVENVTLTLDLPIRRVSDEEHAENMRKLKAKLDDFGTTELTPGQASDVYIYTGANRRYMMQKEMDSFKANVHIARLDDMAFATNPFELFIDFGNEIRAKSPAAQTFLIQLCDGARGYLPTKAAERGSHYSAYVSSGWTGHEGGKLLVEESLKAIRAQFKIMNWSNDQ